MDEGFVIRGQVALTLAGAQAVVSAATAKAREIGVDECIAVVDRAGALVAFARMDAARFGSVEVALTLPIVVDGQVIGAVGVSSGTVDEDVLVAQAGLAPLATPQ
jgi:glc operon protein GlcG